MESGVGPVVIRIATRGSALARWQAEHVGALLRTAGLTLDVDVEVELVIVETQADQRLDIPIEAMGGKGVFVKEIQAAVLDGRADLAVHSAKDLPAITPDGLAVLSVPERADARDVLVGHGKLDALPPGALIATGSIRRRAQLAHARPDLAFTGLRGNIATRLDKVPDGGAIVMAAAALDRLEIGPEIKARGLVYDVLPTTLMLPQVGQGAIAVEVRRDIDPTMARIVGRTNHFPSFFAVTFERDFLATLGGDCTLPVGAHAVATHPLDGTPAEVVIEGLIAAPDGTTILRHTIERSQATDGDRYGAVGQDLARHLLDDLGGAALLAP